MFVNSLLVLQNFTTARIIVNILLQYLEASFVANSSEYETSDSGRNAKAKSTQQILIVATGDFCFFQLPHTADFYRC